MTKKYLKNSLKEVKESIRFIEDCIKSMSKEDLDNLSNDSDLTQYLMDLGCQINEIAFNCGME